MTESRATARPTSRRGARAAEIMADARFYQLAILLYSDNHLAAQHQADQLAGLSLRRYQQALARMEVFARLDREALRHRPKLPLHRVPSDA